MMKYVVIACVMACVASTDAGATGWTMGIKGGVNMANLSGDQAPENSSTRNGIAGGVFAEKDISGRYGFRPELLYIQKGAEGEFVVPGDDHAHESIVKLDYVEVPLLFTATFPAGEKFVFSLFAGPTLGFNMTGEVEVPEHNETEELDSVASFEFGGTFGGGIEYKLSSFSLLADVRYGMGFTSVVEDIAEQSVDVKNNGVAIMAGVGFPIGN